MRCLIPLAFIASVAFAQQDTRIHAREIQHDGVVTTARGDVTLTNGTVRIQADSVTYNRQTQEVEATGNVRIKFLPPGTTGNLQPARRPTLEDQLRLLPLRRFPPDIVAPEGR
jgi:hypothetical protein